LSVEQLIEKSVPKKHPEIGRARRQGETLIKKKSKRSLRHQGRNQMRGESGRAGDSREP